jgi:hypothetical protein
MGQLSRRGLLELGGLSALDALAGNAAGIRAVVATAAPSLKFAAYADVTLLDGPLLDQFRARHATMLAMDEDATPPRGIRSWTTCWRACCTTSTAAAAPCLHSIEAPPTRCSCRSN